MFDTPDCQLLPAECRTGFISAAVFTFKFQNPETVALIFLNSSVSLPLSVLILIVYAPGMLTGGSLLNSWMRGATGKPEK